MSTVLIHPSVDQGIKSAAHHLLSQPNPGRHSHRNVPEPLLLKRNRVAAISRLRNKQSNAMLRKPIPPHPVCHAAPVEVKSLVPANLSPLRRNRLKP